MKKTILFALLFITSALCAKDGRTMYIYDNQGMIYSYPVSGIDSISFVTPASGLNIAPKSIRIRKGESFRVAVQGIGNGSFNEKDIKWSVADNQIADFTSSSEAIYHVLQYQQIRGLRMGKTTLTVTCNEYSSTIPVEVLPGEESQYYNASNIDSLVLDAYSNLNWLHDHWGYWGFSEITTDECVIPTRIGGDWNDAGFWRDMHNHKGNYHVNTYIWENTYDGIKRCGQVIDIINCLDLPKNTKDAYLNELKALKSYFYYVMLDCFGGVPYQQGEYAEFQYGQRLSATEVWSQLVTELEQVAPKLPVVTDANRAQYIGRVTQGMAYSLLARLYLNAESFGCTPSNENYTKAIRCCDAVINSGSYSIEDDYFSNFKIKNEKSRENIFVIVEDGSDNNIQEKNYMRNKLRIHLITLPYAMQKAWNMLEMPWNGPCATESFIKRFEYGKDQRGACDSTKGTDACNGYGWFLGPVKNSSGNVIKDTYYGNADIVIGAHISSFTEAGRNEGARMIKYEVDKTGTYKFSENDFVLFRYADVLYMKAEAILRGGIGNIADVLNYSPFRKIRTRAGVNYYSSLTLNELLDERGREFYWEGLRRRDLLRFGKYNDPSYIDFLDNTNESNNYYPVPTQVLYNDLQQDGIYFASNKINVEYEKLAMGSATNEYIQGSREGLYEKYVYLEAGERFSLIEIDGTSKHTIMVQLNQEDILTDCEPVQGYKGAPYTSPTPMSVSQSGLYHLVYDVQLNQIILMPVEWGIAGAMNAWSWTKAETEDVQSDGQTIEWTWTNVTVNYSYAQFKFKHNSVWKMFIVSNAISINTNLGEDMVPGGDDIEIPEAGIYTIKLKYQLAGGEVKNSFSYEITKTGDVPGPKEFAYSFIGTVNGSWDTDTDLAFKSVNNNHYVFESTVTLTAGEFKIRRDHDWGKSFGYSDMTINGVTVSGTSNVSLSEAFNGTVTFEFDWDGQQETNITLTFGTPIPIDYVDGYFYVNAGSYFSTPNIYSWSETKGNLFDIWPGAALSTKEGDNYKIAYHAIKDEAYKVIINGTEGQTSDSEAIVLTGQDVLVTVGAKSGEMFTITVADK